MRCISYWRTSFLCPPTDPPPPTPPSHRQLINERQGSNCCGNFMGRPDAPPSLRTRPRYASDFTNAPPWPSRLRHTSFQLRIQRVHFQLTDAWMDARMKCKTLQCEIVSKKKNQMEEKGISSRIDWIFDVAIRQRLYERVPFPPFTWCFISIIYSVGYFQTRGCMDECTYEMQTS